MNTPPLRRTRKTCSTPLRELFSAASAADLPYRVGWPKALSQADTRAIALMLFWLEQRPLTMTQQSLFALPAASEQSPCSLSLAPALHRRTTQQFLASVIWAAVGLLAASVKPAEDPMASFATIISS